MDESDGNSIEMRAYIKNHSKLGHRTKSIYNKIVNTYGDNTFSYWTVFRLAKQFCDGRECLENQSRSGQRISKPRKGSSENLRTALK